MSIIPINQTYVGMYNIGEQKESNEYLKSYILGESDLQDGEYRSNRSGWQSDGYFIDRIKSSPDSEPVLQFIAESIENYLYEIGINKDFKIVSAWANVCPKYSYHVNHTHPGCDLSGCYYINVPSESLLYPTKIRFRNPHLFNKREKIGEHFQFQPKNGDCIIFDSGLEHGVEQNLSDELRVSISFNCIVGGKK